MCTDSFDADGRYVEVNGDQNAFLLELNSNGQVADVAALSNITPDSVPRVAAGPAGFALMVGVLVEATPLAMYLWDSALVTLEPIWFAGATGHPGMSVAVGSDGTLAVAGCVSGTLEYAGHVVNAGPEPRPFVLISSGDGAAKSVHGIEGIDGCVTGVAVQADQSVFVGTQTSVDAETGTGTKGVVLSYDVAGVVQWEKQFVQASTHGDESISAVHLAPTADGRWVVGGNTTDAVDFDQPAAPPESTVSAWVAGLDSAGTAHAHQDAFLGAAFEMTGLAVDADGLWTVLGPQTIEKIDLR